MKRLGLRFAIPGRETGELGALPYQHDLQIPLGLSGERRLVVVERLLQTAAGGADGNVRMPGRDCAEERGDIDPSQLRVTVFLW